ncbi:MAG: beta-lactamase family protein [Acidobacteria bacterium]|nr:beta-lactamase family protein [Acidobacteriota bacterium]
MKKFTSKVLTVLLVLGILTIGNYVQGDEVLGQKCDPVKQKLRTYFQQLAEEKIFSGAVLIARDGKILLQDGFGLADYETGKKNKPKTAYGIGSMTKAFTAMSIMMLKERGLLNVNDPIGNYIPGYPNGDIITIHQLMNHTSGIFEYINDPTSAIWDNGLENLAFYHTPDQLLEYFINRPLYYEPGTQWSYCNSGYVVLGVIIEKLSGMTYGNFIKKNILGPLNMRNTLYNEYNIDFPNKAVGYNDVISQPPQVSPLLHPSVAFSAGGIFSTIIDMYKWDQALYTNRLVSQETLNKIFTPGLGDYGYGWFIDTLDINGQNYKQIWHWGSSLGYHSLISRLVDEKVTLILLHNTSAPNDSFDDQEIIRNAVYNILFNPCFKVEMTPVEKQKLLQRNLSNVPRKMN